MGELRWLPKVAEGGMCPACGTHEADPYRIKINSETGERDYSPHYDENGEVGPVCSTMHTVRNHVMYHARKIVDPTFRSIPQRCFKNGHPARGHKVFDVECARQDLERDIARAEAVWPKDRQGWLDSARLLAATTPAGQAARLIALVKAGADNEGASA